jgi:hypothetical protein
MTAQRPCICSTCRQPILPDGLRLSPIQSRIVSAVQRHREISAETLRAIVWADDPNGGPEDPKVLHVHIWHLNQRLAPYGIAVRANMGAGALYRLQPLAADDGYDAADDLAQSVKLGFEVIRERVRSGGKGWGES